MAWTYDVAPGEDTADGRRDAVRLAIGDTDADDQQIQDEEIAFYLSQENDRIIFAAIACARALLAKYSRLVTNSVESARVAHTERVENYRKLISELETESRRKGAGVGSVRAGGIDRVTVERGERDTRRVQPAFRQNQFRDDSYYGNDFDETLRR